jgi:hypothetical protein
MENNNRVAKEREKTALEIQQDIERASCPACIAYRCHTEEEWKNHPDAGHGGSEGKWSKPHLAQEPDERARKQREADRRA